MWLIPLDGPLHRLHRIDGKPFLESADQGIAEPSQDVSGLRERQNVVPDRVIVPVPLNIEPLFPAFHVPGQRPVGEPELLDGTGFLNHIDHPADVDRPETEYPCEGTTDNTLFHRLPGPTGLQPIQSEHLPLENRLSGSRKGFVGHTELNPVMVDFVSLGEWTTSLSNFRVRWLNVPVFVHELPESFVVRFSQQEHRSLLRATHG